MSYWRGRFGIVAAGGDTGLDYPEHAVLLPEGVTMIMKPLGVDKIGAEAAEKVFTMFPDAITFLAKQECDVIIASATLPLILMGWERSQKMIEELRKNIAVPIIMAMDAHMDAMRAFSARKIVMVSPFEEARNEERKKVLESAGFEVVNMKGLGLNRRLDIQRQDSYASYALAKSAFLEAPEADALYISCPDWLVVQNVGKLEYDLKVPVITHASAVVWAALKAMHIRGPVKGYGRLLEELL